MVEEIIKFYITCSISLDDKNLVIIITKMVLPPNGDGIPGADRGEVDQGDLIERVRKLASTQEGASLLQRLLDAHAQAGSDGFVEIDVQPIKALKGITQDGRNDTEAPTLDDLAQPAEAVEVSQPVEELNIGTVGSEVPPTSVESVKPDVVGGDGGDPLLVDTYEQVDIPEDRPEVKYDLFNHTQGEAFIAEVGKIFDEVEKTSPETLEALVAAGAAGWNEFTRVLEDQGFRLPDRYLSQYAQSADGRKDDLPGMISPDYALLSNAILQLWFRELDQALDVPRHNSLGTNYESIPPEKIAQLSKVERMANLLFPKAQLNSSIKEGDVLTRILEDIHGPDYMQLHRSEATSDKEILDELLFGTSTFENKGVNVWAANKDRINRIRGAVRNVLGDSRIRIIMDELIERKPWHGSPSISWQNRFKEIVGLYNMPLD